MPPVKTAAGQDELTHRSRGLGQRHRTWLLLMDGHRSSAEIVRLARQAGVPDRRKPRKLIVAAQRMRHVRHLLSLPGSRARP